MHAAGLGDDIHVRLPDRELSGTFETLMTTPVSDLQVVMAKFTAGLLFYMVVWLPLLACIFFLRYFTHQSALLDPPNERFAMRVFNYSIIYLMALFAFMLADHYVDAPLLRQNMLPLQRVS